MYKKYEGMLRLVDVDYAGMRYVGFSSISEKFID